MKAAVALIFFACFAGSMAGPIIDQAKEVTSAALQQGQAAVTAVVGQLQQQVTGAILQALSGLQATIGGRAGLGDVVGQVQTVIQGHIDTLRETLLGGLLGLLGGGRADADVFSPFGNFLEQVKGTLTQLGQHFLNQGTAAVLGGLGSLGGSRAGIKDILGGVKEQVATAVQAAQSTVQGVVGGIVGNIKDIKDNTVEASKPHIQNLKDQLLGHGLNVLGSLSETVSNVHGSITGGR